MALFENFPYTNLHELNLDWLINAMNQLKESQVFSVNGMTGDVILYEANQVVLPAVPEEAWSMIRLCDGTQRGILFQNDDNAYIVHGGLMAQIYTTGNQPPYPVTRVNGQYGDITLYQDAAVQLPSLTGDDIHSWNIFRRVNNIFRGIEFDDNGSAYIIDSNNRYQIYTDHDNPPYPVSEVNGQTGDVVLFDDENGTVEFPVYTDVGATGWAISREVNGTTCELQLNTDGTLSLIVGGNTYTVYTSNDPQGTWVDDPESDVIEVSSPVELNTLWGFIRETAEGPVGVVVDNASALPEPSAYVQYVDNNDVTHRIKLLTTSDIPAGAGVVSVNGMNGVVVIKGSDIAVSNLDPTKLDVALGNLDTTDQNIKAAMAYNENGNTATQNIPAGCFVIWKNSAYISSQAISLGDTLSLSNLTAVNTGALNNIQSYIDNYLSPLVKIINPLSISTPTTAHKFAIPFASCHYFYFRAANFNRRVWYGYIYTAADGSVIYHTDYTGSDVTITTGTGWIQFNLDTSYISESLDIVVVQAADNPDNRMTVY